MKAHSKETQLLLESKTLNKEEAILICSEKLTRDENWQEIEMGMLVTINSDLSIDRSRIF